MLLFRSSDPVELSLFLRIRLNGLLRLDARLLLLFAFGTFGDFGLLGLACDALGLLCTGNSTLFPRAAEYKYSDLLNVAGNAGNDLFAVLALPQFMAFSCCLD